MTPELPLTEIGQLLASYAEQHPEATEDNRGFVRPTGSAEPEQQRRLAVMRAHIDGPLGEIAKLAGSHQLAAKVDESIKEGEGPSITLTVRLPTGEASLEFYCRRSADVVDINRDAPSKKLWTAQRRLSELSSREVFHEATAFLREVLDHA